MKILRARPWLLPTLALIVLIGLGLSTVHSHPVIDLVYWVALVFVVTGGVLSERSYRRKRGEQRE